MFFVATYYDLHYDMCVSDTTWLLRHKLNVFDYNFSTKFNENKSKMKDNELVKKYFSELKPEIVKKILKIYQLDMDMFGYTFGLETLDIGFSNE